MTYQINKNTAKKIVMFLIIAAVFVCSVSADTSTATGTTAAGAMNSLKKVFGTIYAFFASTYMLVICTAGLVVIGIQMITNRGEPVVMKKLVPTFFAIILIGGASGFCQLFFKPTGNFEITGLTDGSSYVLDGWK